MKKNVIKNQKIAKIKLKKMQTIKIVKLNTKESEILGDRTFLVDKNRKMIICYPIERKILYCLAKINKNKTIIKDEYFLINQTLSELINVGNNINEVEPMAFCLDDFVYELREDIEENSESLDDLLSNCDDYVEREVRVPRMV